MAISLVPYTWTSKALNLFNNDYYKTITGRKRCCSRHLCPSPIVPRWFFSPDTGDKCWKVGDAFGQLPE